MTRSCEVAIVGGGPAGYVAARRLGQLGRDVVLVEGDQVGGTCLNQGCIPTKALYSATEPLAHRDLFDKMGIHQRIDVDIETLRDWTKGVVERLREGVERLLAASGVEVIRARARLSGPGRLKLSTENGEKELEARAVVLATGSAPIELSTLPFDGERIWSSREALALPKVPEHLVVVGGGVIGLELATVYRRLGSRVTVVEMQERLLPGIDLSRRGLVVLGQALKQQGIRVLLDSVAAGHTEVGLLVRTPEGEEEVPCDAILVAVGRRPAPRGLGLETVGIEAKQGFVPTDPAFQAAPGVYAIGDLRGGPLLAHKAAHEGLLVAELLARSRPLPDVDRWTIPQAIFTQPEIGLVGLSEREARQAGHQVVVGRFPFGALGRALAAGEQLGHFQVVAERGSGRLLGAEIVGPHASDLIAEAALAVQNGLTLDQLAETIHAHPTFPEGLWEAALAALTRPLHLAG
ncbi:dihydrolipoyl dehydrogenase [Candidatus Bipolaricaulota bacterium]|nr:dihydrolipoyl dehydrogenase [Candidatus Bipolaricaulota bacterium]